MSGGVGAIIGFSFSLETGSVAVRAPDGRIVDRVLEGHRSHANDALGTVKALMSALGVTPGDVAAVAADVGPGGFTGLRTACGMAQGLAIGWAVPCVAVSSLELMAHQAFRQIPGLAPDASCLTALDARQSEVYVAVWRGDQAILSPTLLPYGTSSLFASNGDSHSQTPLRFDMVCGPGLVHLDIDAVRNESIIPGAHALVDIAARRVAAGQTLAPADCQPLYVRQQIALTTEQRRARAGV